MKNFKLTTLALSLVVSLGGINSVNAIQSNELRVGGVTVYKDHNTPFSKNDEVYFSQTGISGEDAKIIKGYGKDIPFSITLDIVVPKHWDISFNEGADKLLVNWDTPNGGLAWPYVLENLSKQNDISVAIDWERKNVNFYAHNLNDERFKEMENKESYIVDEQGEKLQLEQILKEQEEYARTNELLKEQIREKEEALKEKEDRIAKIQKEMEKQAIENDLNSNYGKALDQEVVVDGDTAVLVNNKDELEDLEISEEELREEYDSRAVLPINSTFDFYKAGGWKQEIDYFTPATYLAKRGDSTKQVLESWAKEIGWELAYKTNVYYSIDYDMNFKGLARESFVEFLSLYRNSQRPLDVQFYTKQKLIVIEDLQFERQNY